MWGTVLKRDLLGEVREEDKFHSKRELREYLELEIHKQGKNVVIKDLDVSHVEDLSGLFEGYMNIESLDLSGWKTSGVKDISEMFYKCTKLKSLNLSGWKTEMEDAGHMFHYCPAPYRVINNKIVRK